MCKVGKLPGVRQWPEERHKLCGAKNGVSHERTEACQHQGLAATTCQKDTQDSFLKRTPSLVRLALLSHASNPISEYNMRNHSSATVGACPGEKNAASMARSGCCLLWKQPEGGRH